MTHYTECRQLPSLRPGVVWETGRGGGEFLCRGRCRPRHGVTQDDSGRPVSTPGRCRHSPLATRQKLPPRGRSFTGLSSPCKIRGRPVQDDSGRPVSMPALMPPEAWVCQEEAPPAPQPGGELSEQATQAQGCRRQQRDDVKPEQADIVTGHQKAAQSLQAFSSRRRVSHADSRAPSRVNSSSSGRDTVVVVGAACGDTSLVDRRRAATSRTYAICPQLEVAPCRICCLTTPRAGCTIS